jgi:hypothetical protein
MKTLAMVVGVLFAAVSFADTKPASAEQVLKELHRTAAPGARWLNFGGDSYVRARIHTVTSVSSMIEQKGERTETRLEELNYQIDDEIVTADWDGDHKEFIARSRCPLEVSDFVESKATRLPDDSVPIGKKVYPAQVYQFEKSFNVLTETRTIRWTFWLSPDVPGGELRRVTESESSDPGYGSREDMKLTDLDVRLVVGGKTLHCYCMESEETDVDGTIQRENICYNDSVPGGIVSKQIRVLKHGQETQRQEYVVIDYHVEPMSP